MVVEVSVVAGLVVGVGSEDFVPGMVYLAEL